MIRYFIGIGRQNYGRQNYVVFQPIIKYFKLNTVTNTDYILSWKSKGLFAESIKPSTTSDNSLTLELNYYGSKTRVNLMEVVYKNQKLHTHIAQ